MTARTRRSMTCCAGTPGEEGPQGRPVPGRPGHPERPLGCLGPGGHDREGRREEAARAQAGLAVDALGLVIAVVVLAASAYENAAGTALLDQVAASTPAVTTAVVDQGFKSSVVARGAAVGIDVQVVERNPAGKGFVPRPNAGSSSRRSASCPSTDAWSATTSTDRPARHRGSTGR